MTTTTYAALLAAALAVPAPAPVVTTVPAAEEPLVAAPADASVLLSVDLAGLARDGAESAWYRLFSDEQVVATLLEQLELEGAQDLDAKLEAQGLPILGEILADLRSVVLFLGPFRGGDPEVAGVVLQAGEPGGATQRLVETLFVGERTVPAEALDGGTLRVRDCSDEPAHVGLLDGGEAAELAWLQVGATHAVFEASEPGAAREQALAAAKRLAAGSGGALRALSEGRDSAGGAAHVELLVDIGTMIAEAPAGEGFEEFLQKELSALRFFHASLEVGAGERLDAWMSLPLRKGSLTKTKAHA